MGSRTLHPDTTAEAYLELLADRGIDVFLGNAGTDFASLVEAFAKFERDGRPAPRPMLVPLVMVAWADGSLDAGERAAILARAEGVELAPGSPARTLLEGWLTRKPDPKLLDAWAQLVAGLAEQMSGEEVAALKAGLLDRARAVAGASGGFLGLGSKISNAEADVIARLDRAFPAGK